MVPDMIVRMAREEPMLRGRVYLCSTRRVPLMHGRACIGFVTPHETPIGWRAGPIYVLPEHRRHGHLRRFYRSHRDRSWVAFVASGNAASLAAHSCSGFTFWKGSRYGQWMKT